MGLHGELWAWVLLREGACVCVYLRGICECVCLYMSMSLSLCLCMSTCVYVPIYVSYVYASVCLYL